QRGHRRGAVPRRPRGADGVAPGLPAAPHRHRDEPLSGRRLRGRHRAPHGRAPRLVIAASRRRARGLSHARGPLAPRAGVIRGLGLVLLLLVPAPAGALDETIRTIASRPPVTESFGWFRRARRRGPDRKSTRLNSSHSQNSYAAFCLKKKNRTLEVLLRARTAREINHAGKLVRRLLRNHVEKTGSRVLAKERSLRPAQHFDAVDVE